MYIEGAFRQRSQRVVVVVVVVLVGVGVGVVAAVGAVVVGEVPVAAVIVGVRSLGCWCWCGLVVCSRCSRGSLGSSSVGTLRAMAAGSLKACLRAVAVSECTCSCYQYFQGLKKWRKLKTRILIHCSTVVVV